MGVIITYLSTEYNTFDGLKNVKVLDLSNNIISSPNSLIKGLNGQETLSNIKSKYGGKLYFNFDYLHNVIKNKPLKVLDMSGTFIGKLTNSQHLHILPQLEILNISSAGTAVFSFTDLVYSQSPNNIFKNL